jgi:quinol-cytochrome oxidoreductase complex cytochrome b subunit
MLHNGRKIHKNPAVRVIAMIILVSFAVVSFYGAIYILMHAGHDCTERPCTLCPCILAKPFAEMFGAFNAAGLIFAVGLLALFVIGDSLDFSRKHTLNLIKSKIRMNN